MQEDASRRRGTTAGGKGGSGDKQKAGAAIRKWNELSRKDKEGSLRKRLNGKRHLRGNNMERKIY